jgi:hypothetical protein
VKRLVLALIVLAGFAGGGRTALAYPQFQLSRDQMCSSCHLAPEGGGMLNENGGVFAQNFSQFGTAPEFMYGKIPLPSWLSLGGDLRAASGYDRTPQQYLVTFPMQAEIYANAKLPAHLRLYIVAGARPSEVGNAAATHAWSREHYLMWSQQDDGSEGWFVRIGRFMPIFGLRYAEHPTYTRRFGGTQLYSETYGAAVEYITQVFEAHATGFIKDPVIDPVAHDNGGAFYGEYRVAATAAVGAEAMYTKSDIDWKLRGGATGKLYLKGPDILLEFEGQVVNQHIESFGLTQLVAEFTATKFLPMGLWLDVGLGHYDENIRIKGLDRDALDVNLHWLTTSHIELIATTRIELINQARTEGTDLGGPTGGYALFQAHYRL